MKKNYEFIYISLYIINLYILYILKRFERPLTNQWSYPVHLKDFEESVNKCLFIIIIIIIIIIIVIIIISDV